MRRDSDMKKVVKFGGSSLASARQFKKVGDIIRADKSRRYVIPSAPGKRNSKDTKVTDMLFTSATRQHPPEHPIKSFWRPLRHVMRRLLTAWI